MRRYLDALAYEIYDRSIRLELPDLEGRIAARRDDFYDRLVKQVLERTEVILQELDRRIEGVSTRHGNELREIRAELAELRRLVEASAAPSGDGAQAGVEAAAEQ